MSTLLIEGGQRLSGSVEVEGNKNAALPLLAACLLTTEECVLTNVPRISDVEVMARLLLDVGAEVEGIGSTTLRVKCPEVVKDEPDSALVSRLRGSVLLAAAAANGVTEIRHAACEPHVVELCHFLQRLGAGVTGGGTPTIRVEGGASLGRAEHRLWGDYIEAGSWAVIAAVTCGEIE